MKNFEKIIRKCEMYEFDCVAMVFYRWNDYFNFSVGNKYLSIKDVKRNVMWLGLKECIKICYINNKRWLDGVGIWKDGNCISKLCLIERRFKICKEQLRIVKEDRILFFS